MIVPHIVKVLYGNDHRLVVVMSALGGGTFLLMCDIVSRIIIYPQEIPTGVMCGIVGGVMFVYLMTKNK
jgi:iron complex transport system permease protein